MIVTNEKCYICGEKVNFEIADDATLLREAKCEKCGASIRNSDVAKIIAKEILHKDIALPELVKEIKNKKILSACASGYIHEKLKDLPGYVCSEYWENVESGQKNGDIVCVDLTKIPFEDNYFDLVISEDVFEHIKTPDKAFKEIDRVINKEGKHIFTVPIHEAKDTVSRENNKNRVYHGDPLRDNGIIVWTDFGKDIINYIEKIAGKTIMYPEHVFYSPEEITDADKTFEEYKEKMGRMETYFKYNSIVLSTKKSNADKTEFTGERFMPSIEDDPIRIEHLQRYWSIKEIVRDKVVVDAACGEGYGSNILAEVAKKVIGVDIDTETVKNANEKYAPVKTNLSYKQASVADLSFVEDHSIDVVVSFETIEHISENDQQMFLMEIKRILRKDGILVMSTPNKAIYSDLHNYHNCFHIKEFYKEEFIKFIQQEFANTKLYNQYFEVTSIIDSDSEYDESVRYCKDKKYPNDGKYYIIIASDTELPKASIAMVVMNIRREYEEKIQRILQLQKEEEERNAHIQTLDQETERLGGIIRGLQEEARHLN